VNKRLIFLGALLVTAALFTFSVFVLKPAKPIIDIKGERLVTIVDSSNDIMDVVITNTLFTSWVAIILLLSFSIWATRRPSLIPSGVYNLFEALIEAIFNFVTGIAGERNGRRFFPVIATFFIYIAFANWLSLTPFFNAIGVFEPVGPEKNEFHSRTVVVKDSGGIFLVLPGAKSIEIDAKECEGITDEHEAEACREHAIEEATHNNVKEGEKAGILAPYLRGINTDLMTPLSFALVSAFFVEYWGITSVGFFRYMGKFFNTHGINAFVGILELIAELARLISFSFRLFGNMMAGEILILVMTFLFAVTAPILVVFYGLELFVGAIQAFVFGTLTLVFAMLAVSEHGPEEHAEEANH
jgi:F-type H+-transporting ATPase subunit a